MTSRIIVAIVAIVAAVLSLAAPVAVDAQTPTLTVVRNAVAGLQIDYSGFTSGTYYRGSCAGRETYPASCTFNLVNGVYRPDTGGHPCVAFTAASSGTVVAERFIFPPGAPRPYYRFAVYSDSACTTEVVHETFTRSKAFPAWRVRDVGPTSATVYIAGAHSTHYLTYWWYRLTPSGDCRQAGDSSFTPGVWSTESPVHVLTGLSPGTEYTYDARTNCLTRPLDIMGTVTFTTLLPPGPAPPTGVEVEATSDGSGSVTLSWSNPGDPDIASYEYYLQRSGGRGEWRTVAGSNADTTSVTIDLTTGEAVAGNARGVTPPMVEWTVYLRARGVNGGSSRATEITFTTLGSASEPEPPEETPEPPESVPALPLAGLVTLALALFLGGQRKRKGHS